ncbi:hypothetical protein [Hoeflea sp. AS16]|jgi:hypothetical protein
MAKGQMRSSKEIRKPKKDKAAAKTAAPLGSAVKQLETNPFQKKAKK